MKLYIVNFYDENESGNVEHNELYTTYKAAYRRFNSLSNNLNCYSWVNLFESTTKFGRIKCGSCIDGCSSCNGRDNYYHGDDSDF